MKKLQVTRLTSLKDKSIGLIGEKDIFPVYFSTRWGIHTYGVLSPIDVLILDNEYRVVKCISNLPPNRIFIWHPKYKHVVELPAEEIEKNTIVIGDQIQLLF